MKRIIPIFTSQQKNACFDRLIYLLFFSFYRHCNGNQKYVADHLIGRDGNSGFLCFPTIRKYTNIISIYIHVLQIQHRLDITEKKTICQKKIYIYFYIFIYMFFFLKKKKPHHGGISFKF